MSSVRLSIIVPFHRNLQYLERCLEALTPLPEGGELIIAADRPVDDCADLARRYAARIHEVPGPSGPAVARNRAAATARGDVLVFIDADVVASDDALQRVVQLFDDQPQTSAAFGAYDETPADPGFVSQYKNLAHSFIHQSSSTIAETFWAGFGAVRRSAFLAVGGFDERFARPSVEDIDLGYRLTRAGYRVVLDPSLRACHLKRWTLTSMIHSDIFDRGIPWTQLILRVGRFNSDLNLKSTYRACVVISYLILLLAGLALADWRFLLPMPVLIVALVLLSPRYYRYFYRQRGWWFAARVVPLHYLYHLYNGLSFATGTALFLCARWTGVELPGALPAMAWSSAAAATTVRTAADHRRARPAIVSVATKGSPVIAAATPTRSDVLGV